MEQVIEGSAGINRFGKDLLNNIRKAKGGEFPVTVTDADIRSALSEMNKDTSDATVRLAAKALEREGVRTPVFAGTMESEMRVKNSDILISGAMKGLSIQESLSMIHEGGKTKARQDAEKMARKAGKSPDDKDWEKTVDKFENNQKEAIGEQEELKGTEGLITAVKDLISSVKKNGSDEDKKKLAKYEKLLKSFEKKE